jgi:thioredoxin reductase (NADPH)
MFEGNPEDFPGGQLTTTTDVENFPGFPEGINGSELMEKMKNQSLKYGTNIISKHVEKIDTKVFPFKVYVKKDDNGGGDDDDDDDGYDIYSSKAIIIATGASAIRLPIPGGDQYWGKGISACAVCDGSLPMFRQKNIIVIGGGDSALEEAMFLSRFAKRVYVVVRKSTLRASAIMSSRAMKNSKITFLFSSQVIKVEGDGEILTFATVLNTLTNTETKIPISGLFFGVGHRPNTEFLNDKDSDKKSEEKTIKLDKDGYIVTNEKCETSVPGIFACGDVKDRIWKQAITAAGSGCMAALSVEHWLNTL